MRKTMGKKVTPAAARAIEEACVCVGLQRAARIIGRRYDAALRPVGLSNWQFTILMRLCGSEATGISEMAEELGMDRTTLTASLKPLERRGLVATVVGDPDRRVRRPVLTPSGHALLATALPLWQAEQSACAELVETSDVDALRRTAVALTPQQGGRAAAIRLPDAVLDAPALGVAYAVERLRRDGSAGRPG